MSGRGRWLRWGGAVAFAALCLGAPAQGAQNNPFHIRALERVFDDVEKVEERVELLQWDEGVGSLAVLESSTYEMLAHISLDGSKKWHFDFGTAFARAESALKRQDPVLSFDALRDLEDFFFRIAVYCECQMNLAVRAVNRSYDDAGVALERGDMKEVVEEMREVSRAFHYFYDPLLEKGVDFGGILAFRHRINEAIAAAQRGEKGAVTMHIELLRGDTALFARLLDIEVVKRQSKLSGGKNR